MKKILIIPIGTVDLDITKDIASALAAIFHCDTELFREMPIPKESFDPKRRQYYSTLILEEIQKANQMNFHKILGVIDVDLYVPQLNFVFGEADVSSEVAIIALSRLRQEFYGLRPDRRLFLERAIKEATHEIGHTYGLDHCRNPRCIMHFSNTLGDTDKKGPGFCTSCLKKI